MFGGRGMLIAARRSNDIAFAGVIASAGGQAKSSRLYAKLDGVLTTADIVLANIAAGCGTW